MCACINANDPLKDMVLLLEDLKRMGVLSVSNIGPSISYVDKDSTIYKVLTRAGITLQNEIDMLKVAKEMGMVTIGPAFDEEDSCRVVAEAQPDVFCFHAGTTKGGLRGFDAGETIEETARRTETVNQKLRSLKKDLILVAHGAAMETPEDAQYMLDHTTCHGFWTGSSTERIPDREGRRGNRGALCGPAFHDQGLSLPPCPRSSASWPRSIPRASKPSTCASSSRRWAARPCSWTWA